MACPFQNFKGERESRNSKEFQEVAEAVEEMKKLGREEYMVPNAN